MSLTAWIVGLEWGLWVVLAAIALTAVFSISIHAGLAMAQDALPYLLILAWVLLILAVIERGWILAIASAALAGYHLWLIVPRFRAERIPHWAASATKLRLVVSNVYTENPTPDILAAGLLAADGDVMVITEWNSRFADALEAAGGTTSHPHRLVDKDDRSEYVVCIASKTPLDPASAIVQVGPLKMAHAVIPSGNRLVQLIGVIPHAVVDPDGFAIWKSQVDALVELVPSLDKPIVLAGDFNTTRFRPEFQALLRTGLSDAHDALGQGMEASFRLSPDGVLAAPGTVVRLDHALLSHDVCATQAENLESGGSDHLPFVMTLAVRQR